MNGEATDPDWAQIAGHYFSLTANTNVTAQSFRGVRWYILKNDASSSFTRINASAYAFVSHLDGKETTESIFNKLEQSAAEHELSRQDVSAIIKKLQSLSLVQSSVAPDAGEQSSKQAQQKANKRKQLLANPLAVKIPLADPDSLLSKMAPRLRFIFSKTTAIVWLAVVLFALYLYIVNSHKISAALNADILEPQNLLAMTLLYIALKTVHEFSHALAVKTWGGEVHEMGISFLVFAPVPYVDASAAWEFREKSKRILVSAMGILSEVFIASVAIFIWLCVEPGMLKTTCLNLAIVASVSTFLFNANPLLKFDGYYILQDTIESPNLYARSKQYCLYLIQRYVFGSERVLDPAYDRGEATWFLLYAPAAFTYRMCLLLIITLYLIDTFLLLGVLLAIWSLYSQVLKPSYKALLFLMRSESLHDVRARSIYAAATIAGVLVGVSILVPLPHTTRVKGIVWVDEQAELYSAQDGFLTEVLAYSGQEVTPGTELLRLASNRIDNKISNLSAQKTQASIESKEEFISKNGKSQLKKQTIELLTQELDNANLDKNDLVITSKVHGVFISPDIDNQKGKHFNKGDFIGYVFSPDNLVVKTVVSQTEIGNIRTGVDNIKVALAEDLSTKYAAQILQETPSGSRQLPSKALGASGGGNIAVTRDDANNVIATEDLFALKVTLNKDIKNNSRVGGIAYVEVEHKNKTLASRISDSIRMIYLNNINI